MDREPIDPSGAYCAFFETEDEAIAHCRRMNAGKTSKDPRCLAVVDGPGGEFDPEWFPSRRLREDSFEANYAVVDLETALDLADDGGPPFLIVT
jgi:predicted FMN-binding regulatory protein PaiB